MEPTRPEEGSRKKISKTEENIRFLRKFISSSRSEQPFSAPSHIHPVFSRENFLDIRVGQVPDLVVDRGSAEYKALVLDPKIYSRITRALTLATVFLRLSAPFFTKVLCAERHIDPLTKAPVLDTKYIMSRDDQILYSRVLLHITQSIVFYFPTDERFTGAKAVAGTTLSKLWQPRIHFGFDFYGFFSRADFDRVPVQSVRGVEVCFASTLLHELSHALTKWRYADLANVNDHLLSSKDQHFEPRFSTRDTQNEIGQCWENWAIGCRPSERKPWWLPLIPHKRPRMQMLDKVRVFALTWEPLYPTEGYFTESWQDGDGDHLDTVPSWYINAYGNRQSPWQAVEQIDETNANSASADIGPRLLSPPDHKDHASFQFRTPKPDPREIPSNAVSGSCYLFRRIPLHEMELRVREQTFMEDIYSNLSKWTAVVDACRSGKIQLSISDGSYAVFQQAYLAVHGEDEMVRMYTPSKRRAWEALF